MANWIADKLAEQGSQIHEVTAWVATKLAETDQKVEAVQKRLVAIALSLDTDRTIEPREANMPHRIKRFRNSGIYGHRVCTVGGQCFCERCFDKCTKKE